MVDTDAPIPPPGSSEPGSVTVYWRPGCFYCHRLLGVFEERGVISELRNIWTDEKARAFVAAHNGGDETVPTVAVGTWVSTNPDPSAFVDELASLHPHLVASVPQQLQQAQLQQPHRAGSLYPQAGTVY